MEKSIQIKNHQKKERGLARRILSFLYYPAAVIIPLLVGTLLLQFGVIPSASMEPNCGAGSIFIANRLVDGDNLQRGDIVTFSHEGSLLVKRVIGLPGDVVTFEGCKVHINGEELDESLYLDGTIETVAFKPRYEVPDGCYFMLGDNRPVSADSRFWDDPFVSSDDIKAKMVFCIKVPGWNAES